MSNNNLDLGQHFMVDENVLNKIIAVSQIKNSEIVLEVGSGEGVLSKKILNQNPKKLICVEIDERLKLELDGMEFIVGNILEEIDSLNFDNFVANIPYHISEPLMIKLLRKNISKITMVTGLKFFDVLSSDSILGLIVKSCYDLELIQELSPEVFNPPPSVTSALLTLKKKEDSKDLFLTFYEHQKQKVKNYLVLISEGVFTKKEMKEKMQELSEVLEKQLYTLNKLEFQKLYKFINQTFF